VGWFEYICFAAVRPTVAEATSDRKRDHADRHSGFACNLLFLFTSPSACANRNRAVDLIDVPDPLGSARCRRASAGSRRSSSASVRMTSGILWCRCLAKPTNLPRHGADGVREAGVRRSSSFHTRRLTIHLPGGGRRACRNPASGSSRARQHWNAFGVRGRLGGCFGEPSCCASPNIQTVGPFKAPAIWVVDDFGGLASRSFSMFGLPLALEASRGVVAHWAFDLFPSMAQAPLDC